MKQFYTNDEFEAYLEMRKMVERAAWMRGAARLAVAILLLAVTCFIVRWLGL